jgi:hypothetical protein
MTVHARSPEDLEMLLEDAFVLRDAAVLADLFEPGAVVASVDGQHRVTDIGDAIWELRYWSDPRRIVYSARTAVVVGGRAVNVMHWSEDGSWRYAICVFDEREDEA